MKTFLKVQLKEDKLNINLTEEEDQETYAHLQVWAAQEQIRLHTINTPGVHVPHAQYFPNTQMENEMLLFDVFIGETQCMMC